MIMIGGRFLKLSYCLQVIQKSIYLLIILLISCGKSQQITFGPKCRENNLLALTKVSSFQIPVDTVQYKHFMSAVYSNDSTLYYFGLDLGRNALDVFDVLHEHYLTTLHFSRPYTFQPITVIDFFVVNPDSIMVFSDISYQWRLVTLDGVVFDNRLVMDSTIEKWHENSIIGLEPFPANIAFDPYNKYLWVPATPAVAEGHDTFFNYPFLMAFDLPREQAIGLFGKYPFHFSPDRQTPFTQASWFNIVAFHSAEEFTLLFNGSPYLLHYNWPKDSIVKHICIKSNYIEFPFPPFKEDFDNLTARRDYSLQNGLYLSAPGPFGPWRYFPVRHPQPLLRADGKRNDYYSAPWSVVVLDSAWQVVGEALFPPDIYDIYNLHNTVQGLLVSKESPNNKENEEDYLEFELYRYKPR